MEDQPRTYSRTRVQSLDLLRGLVMIIMALDHVRDFFNFGLFYVDPTDMATTTPILFFTRWITHFCAPTFVFLAGTAAFLYGNKVQNKKQLSRFLLSRGLWLVVVEIVIIGFAWDYDITFSMTALQVIWAIGCSMIFLSGLVFLPNWFGIGLGASMVLFHNLLDGIQMEGDSFQAVLWSILHQQNFLVYDQGPRALFIAYPLIPWLGVMALGYYVGAWFKKEYPSEKRFRNLWQWGLAMCLAFVALRFFNIYGDGYEWTSQKSAMFSFLDFLNTTKYPPSLLFLCMTLGPAFLLMAWAEGKSFSWKNPMIVFGKVPFFYYVLHFYIIHTLAVIIFTLSGYPIGFWFMDTSSFLSGEMATAGFPLWVTYAVWIFVVSSLYFPCRWYANLKAGRKELVILSYL